MTLVKVTGFGNPIVFPDTFTPRRAQVPEWYYYSPFGQPRKVDISKIRELSEQPWINACVTTLIDKFSTLDWDIVAKDKKDSGSGEIDDVMDFLMRPNENKETLSSIMKKWAKDLLEIDAGTVGKVFSDSSYGGEKTKSLEKNIYYKEGPNKGKIYKKETIKKQYNPLKPLGNRELKEIYAYDGATFQKDTDVTGFIFGWYQYSFKLPRAMPLMFDKDEICYSMRYPRTDRPYGWSVVQSIEKVVLTLKSQVEYFLGFYRERGIPDGIISILDSNKAELERLSEHWKKEVMGRKHKFGMIGRDVKFTPLTITSRDMEVLSTQQWFAKIVMALFKLNIPILALRGEAPKAGLESLRRSEMGDALKPLMQEWKSIMDNNIIPEILQIEPNKCRFEWKFDMYDLEEDERKKAMQRDDVNARIVTVNEVREERGLEPVEWGDEPTNLFNPLGMENPSNPNNTEKPEVGAGE